MHRISVAEVTQVGEELARLGATCRIAVKSVPGGSWDTVRTGLEDLSSALAQADAYTGSAHEVALFTEHEDAYGGIMIWTSRESDVINRFDRFL